MIYVKILIAIPVTKQLLLKWDMKKRIAFKLCRVYLGLRGGRTPGQSEWRHYSIQTAFCHCICGPGLQCKPSLIVDNQRTKHAADEMRLKGYQGSGFDCIYTLLWFQVLCLSLSFFFGTLLFSCPQNKAASHCGGKLEASFTSYWAC